jgi:putative tricarboxylic transport membrane protein
MEIVQGILNGFQVAFQPINLLYCFIGVFIGTLVGVLPGLGPAAAIALLLPSTFALTPVASIIMLAGIYYGAMYGAPHFDPRQYSRRSGLGRYLFDGHAVGPRGVRGPPRHRRLGSFIAGTLSIVVLTFSPSLVKVTLSFGPPEYFALMVLGITWLPILQKGRW